MNTQSESISIILNLVKEDFEAYKKLPIGVYAVTIDGTFVNYNKRASEIFALPFPPTEKYNHNIVNYYQKKEDRVDPKNRILSNEENKKLKLSLFINNKNCILSESNRPIIHPESQKPIGILCVVEDYTEEEIYHQIFDKLPIGIFQFDENDSLQHANQKFWQMLKYRSLEEAQETKYANNFLAGKETPLEIKRKIMEEGGVSDMHAIAFCNDGKEFRVNLNIIRLEDDAGNYKGFIGSTEDESEVEFYREIIEEAPIGLYKIEIQGDKHIVTHCNQTFSEIFGFDTKEEMIGQNVRDLIPVEIWETFYDELIEQDSTGKALEDYTLQITDQKGKLKYLQKHCRLLKDSIGIHIGRVGSEKDITENRQLTESLEALRADIGNMLHTFSSTLAMAEQSIRSTIQSHGWDLIDEEGMLDLDKTLKNMDEEAKTLLATIQSFYDGEGKRKGIKQDTFKEKGGLQLLALHKKLNDLINPPAERHYLEVLLDSPERKLAAIHFLVDGIREIVIKFPKSGVFAREKLRLLVRDTAEVLRISNLYHLSLTNRSLIEMDIPVKNLREYILLDRRNLQESEVLDLSKLIGKLINELQFYAHGNKVKINYYSTGRIHNINAVRIDMKRLFYNLLHNSIKYSWTREGEGCWVDIKFEETGSELVVIIQNFGVPIHKTEIEENLVFKMGYRGMFSEDRDRAGTGVGLYDCLQTARRFGGDLRISSYPAHEGVPSDHYTDTPFLTTAIVTLPLK